MKITNYGGPEKQILKFPENTAIAVALDATAFASIAAANEGIVPAGTFLHFDLENRAVKAVPSTADAEAVGVLRHDTKLDGKEANAAAAIIHGFIDLTQIPNEPTAAQKTALNLIKFIK